MPAIQLARLRLEVAELAEHFQNPDHFSNHLMHLMEYYSNRTRRTNLRGAPPPTLKTFDIPQPVFRQLIVELGAFADSDPEASLRIIDRCWSEPVYEFRLLAIRLIALIAPEPPEKILSRVQSWLDESIEDAVIQMIFEIGLIRIREETQLIYVSFIEKFLSSKEEKEMGFGLIGLLHLTKSETYINLPAAFKMLQSAIEHEKKYLRPYLISIIKQLVKISPQETAYVIKNILSNSQTKEAQWLVRQSLEFFPNNLKNEIKTMIRKNR